MTEGYAPLKKEVALLGTITKLYEQQQYMYDKKVHVVTDRIVSINQPWIRPIVRGRTKKPTEIGAKLGLSINEQGYAGNEDESCEV